MQRAKKRKADSGFVRKALEFYQGVKSLGHIFYALFAQALQFKLRIYELISRFGDLAIQLVNDVS